MLIRFTLLSITMLFVACSAPTPTPTQAPPTATPTPTATATPTSEPTATPTPVPTATPTPRPTPTPVPPVSINSDCIGCPVVMPGDISNPATSAYREWPSVDRHPAKVLLVTCARGDTLGTNEEVMGPKDDPSEDIIVKYMGANISVAVPLSNGTCLAITARYDGLREVCYSNYPAIGTCIGTTKNILAFRRVGAVTDLSTTQFNALKTYARTTEYP